jgi:hypothetical protein
VALLALLAFVDAIGLTRDPDIFWHLRIGRAVLETHSTLPREVFSYSAAGKPWTYKDLVADLVLYVGFARFGYAWFVALKVAAVAAMALACRAIVRPRDRHPLVLLFCVGLLVDSFWLVERPNLFSMVLFAGVLALVERARRFSARSSPEDIARALAPILVVDVLWSSLHAFAILGHLLLLGFAATLVCARLARDTPLTRTLWGPRPSLPFVRGTVLCAFAGPILALANLSGDLWRSVFLVAASAELRARILEWKRLGLIELAQAFPIATAVISLAVVALAARLVAAVRARDADAPVSLAHAATLLALVAMTASSVRWLPYAAIAAPLFLAMILGERLSSHAVHVPRGASILLGIVLLVLLRIRQGEAPTAIGEDPDWSPRGAVRFASEHGLRGRVVNSMEFGGYLLFASWPDVRVLVDGRTGEEVYEPAFVVRCLLAEHDAQTFFAMRNDEATWVFAVNRPDQVAYGFLAHDPKWSMVYWSDTAAVYVRRDAHAELESSAFRFVDPYDVPGSIAQTVVLAVNRGEKLDAVFAEVNRLLNASPDSIRANLALAALLGSLGAAGREDLEAVLARLLVLAHDSPGMQSFVRSIGARNAR